jgi:hypothetical protein
MKEADRRRKEARGQKKLIYMARAGERVIEAEAINIGNKIPHKRIERQLDKKRRKLLTLLSAS